MPPAPDADDFRTDEELTRAHQRGDAAALAVLVRRNAPRLRAFVYGNPLWVGTGNAILRHVWTAADRGMREGKCRGSFRPWLFKVADAVAAKHTGHAPSERSAALTTCFGRLIRANPKLHRLVMWVSHGLNRTVVAKRHRLTKARLKERYTRAVAAVRDCLSGRSDTPTDRPNQRAAQ